MRGKEKAFPAGPQHTWAGLTKRERIITTHQTAHIAVASGQKVLNLCANNYLGLADHATVPKDT